MEVVSSGGVSSLVLAVVAIAAVIIVFKVIGTSLSIIKGILANSIMGVIILWILKYVGVGVTINWWSALLAGFFGILGVIGVCILQLGMGM